MQTKNKKLGLLCKKNLVRLELQAIWCGHIHLLVGAQPPKQTMHHKHTATLQIKKICQTQVAQLQTKNLHQIQTWTLPKLAMTARFCRQTMHAKQTVHLQAKTCIKLNLKSCAKKKQHLPQPTFAKTNNKKTYTPLED